MKSSFTDPYAYPGTSILRNLLDIRDASELESVEEVVVGLQLFQLYQKLPSPPHDLDCLLSIHRILFSRLYPFAGKLREQTGRMTKVRESGSVVIYGDSAYISEQLALVMTRLATENTLFGLSIQAFAERAAYFYGEINAIHPFREGNSRSLRLYFSAIAQATGYRFDWSLLAVAPTQRQELYRARDRAVMNGDSTALAELFASILSPL